MKKTITFLSVLIISVNAFTQISTNETPFSFKEKLEKDDIPTIVMAALNYEIIEKEDSVDNLNGLPPRFGFDFDVDINMENSGQWIDLKNHKGKIWKLEIYCPGALSINLLYDKFYIPEGVNFLYIAPIKIRNWEHLHTAIIKETKCIRELLLQA